MAYSADWTLSQTAAFQQQVTMSIYKAAISISNEASTTHPSADAKRHNLATQVLTTQNFQGTLMPIMVPAVIEAGGLVTGATDAQVDTAVATAWNAMAGVSNRDLTNLT